MISWSRVRLDGANLTERMIMVMPLTLQSATCKYRCAFMVMRVPLEGVGQSHDIMVSLSTDGGKTTTVKWTSGLQGLDAHSVEDHSYA